MNRDDETVRLVPLTGLQIAHLAGLLAHHSERPDPRMSDDFSQWERELAERLASWFGAAAADRIESSGGYLTKEEQEARV